MTGPAGNHTDLSNVEPMLDPLLNQAAWFRSQCRVVAPLYRQATLLGLNGAGAAERETVAFNDVAVAFRAYLQRDNNGRPFVLMGHSQGSFMAERLLTSVILPDAALRAKLIVALFLGGSVQVPIGTTTNGTLGAFPLCTSDDQTGCALAWHTFGLDHGPTPGGVYPVSLLPWPPPARLQRRHRRPDGPRRPQGRPLRQRLLNASPATHPRGARCAGSRAAPAPA